MNNPLEIPLQRFQQALDEIMHRLPAQLGAEVVKFSHERWAQQGWLGARFEPWKQRKGGGWGKADNPKRGLLLQTGRLRRSVRVVRVTADYVVVGTDVPYARVHNEGFSGRVTQQVHAHERKKTSLGITGSRTGKTRTRITYGRKVTGTGTVKAHTRTIYMKIPRRQFLGDSPYLQQRLQRFIAAEIMKAAKRF